MQGLRRSLQGGTFGVGRIKVQVSWRSLVVQWVKDLGLSLQRVGSLLCGFDSCSRNFHMLWTWPKIKIKNKTMVKEIRGGDA